MGRKPKNKAAISAAPPSAPPDEEIFDEESGEPEKPAAAAPEEHHEEPPPTPVNFSPEPEPEVEQTTEEAPRRKERKPYTKKKKSRDREEENSGENISKMLRECHDMLSALTGIPELLLAQEEADKMGDAIADVQSLYPDVGFISPEIAAWSRLAMVGVVVYWPRIVLIRKRLKEEEAKRDINVTPISASSAAVGQ